MVDTQKINNLANALNNKYEHSANKSTTIDNAADNTTYPTTQAVKNYVDSNASIGDLTLERQTNADTGYSATYVLKSDGTQLGDKINIPKDFLVKSATISTVTNNNTPVNGYTVGDKYIDFVINSKDNSATAEHLYLLVTELGAVYTADNTTLELSNNNQFSVKAGGIGTTQLSSEVNAILDSVVTMDDVDDEIEAYNDALIESLGSISVGNTQTLEDLLEKEILAAKQQIILNFEVNDSWHNLTIADFIGNKMDIALFDLNNTKIDNTYINEEGKCIFYNIPNGNYIFNTSSIVDGASWLIDINDSNEINIDDAHRIFTVTLVRGQQEI